MSYDVYLTAEVDTGGEEPLEIEVFWRNYTSNCGPMWRAAGADLAEMNGKPAADCGPVVAAAVAAMKASPGKYVAMNPSNGWGDSETCMEFLQAIADACAEHPKLILRVSH